MNHLPFVCPENIREITGPIVVTVLGVKKTI